MSNEEKATAGNRVLGEDRAMAGKKEVLGAIIRLPDETVEQFDQRTAFFVRVLPSVRGDLALAISRSLCWRNIRYLKCRYSDAVEQAIFKIDPDTRPNPKSKARPPTNAETNSSHTNPLSNNRSRNTIYPVRSRDGRNTSANDTFYADRPRRDSRNANTGDRSRNTNTGDRSRNTFSDRPQNIDGHRARDEWDWQKRRRLQ